MLNHFQTHNQYDVIYTTWRNELIFFGMLKSNIAQLSLMMPASLFLMVEGNNIDLPNDQIMYID